MATFPSSVPSYTGFTSSHTLSQDQHAAQHNSEQGDIIALAQKVGTGASTPTNNTVLRGNGTGTTTYDQLHLGTDVSGVLGTSSGGTGQTNLTTLPLISPAITGGGSWTGAPVLSGATIADFTNAQHNHQTGPGGGTLNAANALSSGSINFANLLASIFSSQVTSYTNTGTGGGTGYYINLGGIKLCWGLSNSISLSGAAPIVFASNTISLPAAFFSSIQMPMVSIGANPGGNSPSYCTIQISSSTTSTISYVISMSDGANPSLEVSWLIIGT